MQTDTSFDFTRRKADTSSTQLTSTFMEDNKRHLRGHKFVHGMDANEERMWWWSKKEIPVDEWVKSFLPPEHDKDLSKKMENALNGLQLPGNQFEDLKGMEAWKYFFMNRKKMKNENFQNIAARLLRIFDDAGFAKIVYGPTKSKRLEQIKKKLRDAYLFYDLRNGMTPYSTLTRLHLHEKENLYKIVDSPEMRLYTYHVAMYNKIKSNSNKMPALVIDELRDSVSDGDLIKAIVQANEHGTSSELVETFQQRLFKRWLKKRVSPTDISQANKVTKESELTVLKAYEEFWRRKKKYIF
ncbi:unnamed protein product [Peronospora belbahrii]|uniref:RxLR effector protein n=1 Tax=Peronospora belbahrii TaxID=622444 RepID=A0ABN8D8B0_9STRA|nr:unnamed protein product [Peronospora belbahrii]